MSIRLPTVIVFVVLAAGAGYALSEWIDRPAAAARVTAGTTLDRGAPAPRDASGRPDLSGVWQAESMPLEDALKVYPGGVNGAQTIGEHVPAQQLVNLM